MSIYKSPVCSCIICKKEYSSKGIYSHYISFHTIEGNNRMKLIAKLGSKLGGEKTKTKFKNIKDEKILNYYKNPKYCLECYSILDYEKYNGKFCGNSCSITYSNKRRKRRKHKTCTKNKISNSLKNKEKIKYTNVEFRKCKYCQLNFIYSIYSFRSRTWCSESCQKLGLSKNARNNPGLGTKRSKDEIKLFELCKDYFTKVTSNEKLFNGWDADILIYDTKTAILWNGPWHYREMNIGNHSLKQVQNRDNIKIKEIKSLGWNVIIFEDRYYTPESAFETIKINGGPGGI